MIKITFLQILELILRTTFTFALVMVLTRILGKQTIARMTYHDFVAAITLGGIAATMAIDLDSKYWHIGGSMIVFVLIAYLLTKIALASRVLRKWINGTPTVLMENGKVLENNMKKLKLNLDSLDQSLRGMGIFDIEEVEYAILETNGELSILKKEQYLPVTKKDLNILLTPNRRFPIEVVMDGEVIVDNMRDNKLTQEWLDEQLRKRKVMLSEVCYAVLGTSGKLYIDLYKDQMNSIIDVE